MITLPVRAMIVPSTFNLLEFQHCIVTWTFSSLVGVVALGARIIMSYTLVALWDNMVIAYAEGLSWVLLFFLYLFRFLVKRRDLGMVSENKAGSAGDHRTV